MFWIMGVIQVQIVEKKYICPVLGNEWKNGMQMCFSHSDFYVPTGTYIFLICLNV